MRLPDGDGPVNVTIDTARGAVRPDRRSQLVLDRRTGAVVRSEPYSSQSPARRLRGWLRWMHTGEAGGVWGQTAAGIASAGRHGARMDRPRHGLAPPARLAAARRPHGAPRREQRLGTSLQGEAP